MSKKVIENTTEQVAGQEQVQATEAQPKEQPQEQNPEEAENPDEEEKPQEEQPEEKYDIVVCAYPGTEEKMSALWKRALGDKKFLVILAGPAVSGETPVESGAEEITALAERLVARNDVDDVFVLVPPNTFPTRKLRQQDFAPAVVYVDAKGDRKFAHRLPQSYSKDVLTTLLAEKEFWNPEEFAKRSILACGHFPLEVGMSFGNYVTNVLRATPCENKVIEAVIKKLFISCNIDGWKGVEGIVDKILADE